MKKGKMLFALAALLLAGCESPMFEGTVFERQSQNRRLEVMRVQSKQDETMAELQRVAGQLQEIERSNIALNKRLERLEGRVNTLSEAKPVSYDQDISVLRREIQQVRSENQQMRKQVADDLAKRIDGIARQQQKATAKAQQTAAPVRGSGYEHIVEKGQTLSEIARGYGVSIATIRKANNLKSDNLRVGQKLFVPDK